jgi:hypothetical protein
MIFYFKIDSEIHTLENYLDISSVNVYSENYTS